LAPSGIPCQTNGRDSENPATDWYLTKTPEARPLSEAVVHVELDRMRRHREARDLLLLQADVRVDQRVGQHAAGLEEAAVLVERLERLHQRVGHGRNLLLLLGLEVVEVLVRRRTRVELVLDAVEAGHHHRDEAVVRVRRAVREADLDAPGL